MRKVIVNITVWFTGLIFMIASTGMFLNFHHCTLTDKTDVLFYLPDSHNCCSSHPENECDLHCDHSGHGKHKVHSHNHLKTDDCNCAAVYLENTWCCSDNPLYISVSEYLPEKPQNPDFKKYLDSIAPENAHLRAHIYEYDNYLNKTPSLCTLLPDGSICSGKQTVYLHRQLIL